MYPALKIKKEIFSRLTWQEDIRIELQRNQLHKCSQMAQGYDGWNYSSHTETKGDLGFSGIIKSVV